MKDKKDNNSRKKISKQQQFHEKDRTPLDEFESQKFTDSIPLKDLKIETEQENNKHKTQDDSQSEEKFKADFDKHKE